MYLVLGIAYMYNNVKNTLCIIVINICSLIKHFQQFSNNSETSYSNDGPHYK